MCTDLNRNGYSLLNANVDGVPLLEVKKKAYAASEYADVSEQWALASHQYVSDAEGYAASAAASLDATRLQAILAGSRAETAAASALSVANSSQLIGANTTNIAALTATVAANKASAESAIDANASSLSSLSSTVTANKAAADATASSLSSLSSTVASNKTSADSTATALTALTTRVTTEEAKVQSVAKGGTGSTTASAARTALGVGYTATTSDTQQIYYYDNGMMLIHTIVSPGSVPGSSYISWSYTFPVAFASAPHISCTSVVGNSGTFITGVEGLSATAANGFLFNNNSSAKTPALHILTFGVKA